ncbi:MAG: Ser-Thr-rich GPI-anchored membrane family protein, partial [Sedimentisphaerales bacterium]
MSKKVCFSVEPGDVFQQGVSIKLLVLSMLFLCPICASGGTIRKPLDGLVGKEIFGKTIEGSYDFGQQQVLVTKLSIELEGDADWGIYTVNNASPKYVLPYITETMGSWDKNTDPLSGPFYLDFVLHEGDPYPLAGMGEIEFRGACDLPPSARLLSNPSITLFRAELVVETAPISACRPNGGETWQSGTTHTITWISSSYVGFQVKIELYKGGSLDHLIIGETANSNGGHFYGGSYDWSIPENQTPSSDYKIKVTSIFNSSEYDYSDENFTITPLPQDDNTIYPAKLVAFDGQPEACFGETVSISDNYAIVGAPYDNNGRGSAYIFEHSDDGWIQQQPKLTHSHLYPVEPVEKDDYFGCSVSISGNDAIVGIEGDRFENVRSGSVYIFHRTVSGWRKRGFVASDRANGDHFGCAVCINGDYAIIGAYGDDDNGRASGSAYVFKRDGTSWTEQAKLKDPEALRDDCFGASVSINGGYAIVGACPQDSSQSDSGAAYIFKRDGSSWTRKAKLSAPVPRSGDEFGRSVSLNGDYAIIGAMGDDTAGQDAGAAYIFKRSGENWT